MGCHHHPFAVCDCRPGFSIQPASVQFIALCDGVAYPGPTARRILNLFRENNLLKEIRKASGQKPAILAFTELMNIAEGRSVF